MLVVLVYPCSCIPIVSKNDFLVLEENGKHERETDVGIAAWNTVAVSPFVKHASVGTWEDLPGLLDRLQNEPPEVLAKLQVRPWQQILMVALDKSATTCNAGGWYMLESSAT